jgi:hypothetical protein
VVDGLQVKDVSTPSTKDGGQCDKGAR